MLCATLAADAAAAAAGLELAGAAAPHAGPVRLLLWLAALPAVGRRGPRLRLRLHAEGRGQAAVHHGGIRCLHADGAIGRDLHQRDGTAPWRQGGSACTGPSMRSRCWPSCTTGGTNQASTISPWCRSMPRWCSCCWDCGCGGADRGRRRCATHKGRRGAGAGGGTPLPVEASALQQSLAAVQVLDAFALAHRARCRRRP